MYIVALILTSIVTSLLLFKWKYHQLSALRRQLAQIRSPSVHEHIHDYYSVSYDSYWFSLSSGSSCSSCPGFRFLSPVGLTSSSSFSVSFFSSCISSLMSNTQFLSSQICSLVANCSFLVFSASFLRSSLIYAHPLVTFFSFWISSSCLRASYLISCYSILYSAELRICYSLNNCFCSLIFLSSALGRE